MRDLLELEGKRVLLTGTGAIGTAVAHAFTDAGARVGVWDRLESPSPQVAECADFYRRMDVSSPAEVDDAIGEVAERWGHGDILVTTAAVATFAPVDEMTPEQWQQTIDINLTGVFLTCRAFLRRLVGSAGATIVNVASIGGLRGEADFAHYCAAKFGVIGLSQSLAREVGERNVRVNCVAPGAVDSPMNTDTIRHAGLRHKLGYEAVSDAVRQRTPLGRFAEPWEIANAVLFLASGLSSYIHGATLPVTGGAQ